MTIFDQNLYVKDNKVYAKVRLPKKYPLYEFKGKIVSRSEIKNLDFYLQIGLDKFIGPSGDNDDLIAHSCNPTSYVHIVGNRAFLYSLFEIKPNMQITFDYSVTSTDTIEQYNKNCSCKDFNCRKIISGFNYLPDDIKQKYKLMKIVPNYIGG